MNRLKYAKYLRRTGLSKDDIYSALKNSFPYDAPPRSVIRKLFKNKPRSYFKSKPYYSRRQETVKMLGQEGLDDLLENYVKAAIVALNVKRVGKASEEIKRFVKVLNSPNYKARFEVEGS